MKKTTIFALTLIFALLLTACANPTAQTPQEPDDASQDTYSIVATAFHEYDWLMQILGAQQDRFSVTLLMDTGVDMHSYEPSVQDIATISSADLFIYNGGLSQEWVADVIAQPLNANLKTINIMERLGDAVQAEVTVEGMQAGGHAHAHAEDAHDHAEDAHEPAEDAHDHAEDAHDHAAHDDEHVWLSLHNAMTVCQIVADELASLDAQNADTYQANVQAYIATLAELDAAYQTAISEAARDTIVFADRFPFLYMMQDYELDYFAAFQGCSAETEASFDTVTFLSETVNALDINTLLIIDNGMEDLAHTINQSSRDQDSQTLVLHSMQSVAQADIDNGASYYGYMVENLETLKLALAQ